WRASGIFPASLNARAFAKAWLSADRSAADSFPGRALWALRSAVNLLRIGTDPSSPRRAANLSTVEDEGPQYPCHPARRRAAADAGTDRGRPRHRGTRRGGAP